MDLELWKKRKKELHLNYEKLAEKSGVSKRTIEDIFRGFTTNPRIDTVEAIERALELYKVEIPSSMVSGDKDDYFVLRVKGDSMYPRLLEGDTILCKRCDSVDSGSLAVILYNGDEATVKKVNYVQGQNWLELIPFNPEYPTKRIEGADLEQCRILGLVVKLIRDL